MGVVGSEHRRTRLLGAALLLATLLEVALAVVVQREPPQDMNAAYLALPRWYEALGQGRLADGLGAPGTWYVGAPRGLAPARRA